MVSVVAGLWVVFSFAVSVPCALANFEWLGSSEGAFAAKGEEGEIGEFAGGVAVDDASGEVYIADGIHRRVTVFTSKGEFAEAWGWGVADEVTEAFQRCGPKASQLCARKGRAGEGVSQFWEPGGVAVDQATGDVYVLDLNRQNGVVQVFSANGEFISSFGDIGGQGKSVSEDPESIRTASRSGIAVNSATGEVFVVDRNGGVPIEGRVMVFKPTTPEDYAHYVYEGLEHDFASGTEPLKVATDSAGDVFVSSESAVYKYGAGSRVTSAWRHEDNKELQGMAVNTEAGGAVFYYTATNRKFHELNSLTGDPIEGGEWPSVSIFEEFNGKFETVFEEQTEGLAYNPGLVWSVGRPPGVLYAIDPHLVAGLIFAQPPLEPPSVGSEFVSGVGVDSGSLEADINPHGFDTHYVFQYGVVGCAFESSCSREVPAPLEGDAGSGGVSVGVSVPVTGLMSGVSYHFRVVASSFCHRPPEELVKCVVPGSDGEFSTFGLGTPGQSDGRVLELVSPPIKNGGDVFPLSPSAVNCEFCMPGVGKVHFPMQSTANGRAIVYEGDPFTLAGGAVSENEYLSGRGGDGWALSRDLSPVLESKEVVARAGFKAFSPDLSRGVLYQIAPSLEGAPAGYPDLYLEDTGSGSLRALVTEAPVNRGPAEFKLAFAGGSSDFSHLIFEANGVVGTESPVSAPSGGVTENDLYEWANGRLRLVNILSDDTSEPGAVFGAGNSVYSHAISADGSRLFWTDENHAHGHFGRVYVRVKDERTLEVPDGEGGSFLTASTDGAEVLLNDGRLYNVGDESVVEAADLTGGHRGFQGILGASDDLSTVYFVDTAVLTGTEENGEGAIAKVSENNLYYWWGGTVKFVGVLGGGDNSTNLYHELAGTGDWSPSPSTRTAQVTPDGRYLAFMSALGLTGRDSGVFEVYEYDSAAGRLVCASCNPTGERPIGPSLLGVIQPTSGYLPQPQNLSLDGRVFFDSYDELSPNDTNGDFEDVYEYVPSGLGSCARPDGCISLISGGDEATNSSFVNATPSGSDVFFTTFSQLVPQDQDDQVDLYDARVGGTPTPPKQLPPCGTSEACRETPPSALPSEALPSTTITGLGNIVPAPLASLPGTHTPTRTELLSRALRACRKLKAKKKRAGCEARARRLYGAAKKTEKAAPAHAKKGFRVPSRASRSGDGRRGG
jgi:hypothetical protein